MSGNQSVALAETFPHTIGAIDVDSYHGSKTTGTVMFVTVAKMSIAMPTDLRDEARAAAAKAGLSVSGWIAEAVAQRIRQDALAAVLDDWQREHGALTEEEIREAEVRLGFRQADT